MTVLQDERPRILGEKLRSARESLALLQQEVADAVAVDVSDLSRWEGDLQEPLIEDLWKLADFYERDVDYFLRATPTTAHRLSFRLQRRASLRALSLETRRILVRFEELCRSASELLEITGRKRSVQVPGRGSVKSPRDLADSERQRLNLDGKPVADLRELISAQDVWIFELPVHKNEFSGFSFWHESFGPCMLINALDVPGRRTFTIAHEYAHLLKAQSGTVCDPFHADSHLGEERFADKFAALLLMPEADVKQQFKERGFTKQVINIRAAANLSRRYGVSVEAMVRRLGELELIDEEILDALLREGEPKQYFRRGRMPSWQRRLGQRYVSLALEAYQKGSISGSKLARYLGVDTRIVRQNLLAGPRSAR